MKDVEWNVVHAKGMKLKGSNNAGQDRFRDRIIPSLTREVTQNSLDAHNYKKKEPTKISYETFQVSTSLIPGINQIREDIFPKAKKFWNQKGDIETIEFLDNFEKIIMQKEVTILKISDFNTKGLNKNNYDSLVLGESYSVKDSEDSAGSKGIGKAAPFVASDLRMVFYNSYADDCVTRSAGMMNFVSYQYNEEDDYTQDSIAFYNQKTKVNNEQITFKTPNRQSDNFGTDLYIIGLIDIENFEKQVILSTVNNFLVTLMNNQLIVNIGKYEISQNSLSSLMTEIELWIEEGLPFEEKNEIKETLNFYEVLTSQNSIKISLDGRFNNYEFIECQQDGELIILEHENANRTVLQTRKAGMKINTRNRINGNINFSGVFQATGKKLNKYLKELESANHDDWSPNRKRTKEEEKTARIFLNDLLRFYKESVKENFGSSVEDEVEAFGVSDFLPLMNESKESDEKSKDTGIKNAFNSFHIKENIKSSQVLSGKGEEDAITRAMELAGVGEGENSGSGSRRTGNSGGNNPNENHGSGEDSGMNGKNVQGNPTVIEKEKHISISDIVKMKIIDNGFTSGNYYFLAISSKKVEEAEFEIRYVGADGKSYPISINDVESKTNETLIRNNKIIVYDMKKNQQIKVDFKIKSKLRIKMEVVVNEIKR